MLIDFSKSGNIHENLKINNEPVETVNYYTYLGITILMTNYHLIIM